MATRSFDPDGSHVATAERGQRAHVDHLAQLDVIRPQTYEVRDGVWCVVGNGLSNQTFIAGPQGLIAIDTGESVQEMQAALAALREHTDAPVVAVVYTHFHYVRGTRAVLDERPTNDEIEVVGHERISANLARASTEIGPAYRRGAFQQFGVSLPTEGPDGLVHCGLGYWLRNPAHAPFTPGFVPPTRTLDGATSIQLAGLTLDITPAPSDADDSITIWFPELDTAVHNLVWPALFNVFAIRGEEYRDPQVVLAGIDHLLGLGAEYLVGTHGPPLSGRAEIHRRVTRSRDAIQFLWDQTVRGINRGWTTDELATGVRLPDLYDDDYLTSERYGVAEHHVRQIHNGLRGWFDGDESKLFPLAPADRYARLIAGFGGRDTVRQQALAALEGDDLRWAADLATWLVRSDGATDDDRRLLADVLRAIGSRSPAANIRNWCLVRALDLDGTASIDRMRVHRLGRNEILADPAGTLRTLRVMLDPDRADGVDGHIGVALDGTLVGGLHIRNSIAAPTDGTAADALVRTSADTWADLLTGATTWKEAVERGQATVDGDADVVERALACFDLPRS